MDISRLLNRRIFGSGLAAGLVSLAPSLAACSAAPPPAPPGNGGVQWFRLAGGQRIWTRRFGDGGPPVLILHGGPGFSHDYLENFADHLPAAGCTLYVYDQLDCGLSDRPGDAGLWTVDRYVREVEEVRQALRLDRFVLYGHGWGALLALEYALLHPERLAGLVLSSMTASLDDRAVYAGRLRARLPPDVRDQLDRAEAQGDDGLVRFNEVVERELYPRHLLRLEEWPEPVIRTFEALNVDRCRHMLGANAFGPPGSLRDWDRWADLRRVAVPMLAMGALHDEIDPDSVRAVAAAVGDGRVFISQSGSHLAMWDDEAVYFSALIDFLDSLGLLRRGRLAGRGHSGRAP